MSLKNPLIIIHTFINRKELKMEGNSAVNNVGNSSVNNHVLRNTGVFKIEGTVMRIIIMKRAFLLCPRKHLPERNIPNLISLGKLSAWLQILCTRKYAHKRNILNAATVRKPLSITHTFRHTWELTVEKNSEWKEYRIPCIHSTSLTVHIQTHTIKTNFLSKECGKDFRYFAYLNIPMWSHTGEEPFECKIYGKAFMYSLCLNICLCTHSAEKL